MTNAVAIAQQGSNNTTFRNRIINGACVIDQRNAGASVTIPASNQYTLDRWYGAGDQASKFTIQQNAGSVTPPVGFTNYLGATSSSAYSVGSGEAFLIAQRIEGYNFADLQWGTANAKTITLSFWVRSSLTGTFGGGLINSAADRSYPFSYTISSANTWEQKTITVAGDTTGTWVGATNGIAVRVTFSIGAGGSVSGTANAWAGGYYPSVTGAVSVVGTNGATFYLTGVQLEAGSAASPFENRSYTTELQLCQRYYEKSYNVEEKPGNNSAVTGTNRLMVIYYVGNEYSIANQFKVTKRTGPSISLWDYDGTANIWRGMPSVSARSTSATSNGQNSFYVQSNGTTADTALQGFWAADAEL